jgi:hypothetical protein
VARNRATAIGPMSILAAEAPLISAIRSCASPLRPAVLFGSRRPAQLRVEAVLPARAIAWLLQLGVVQGIPSA